MNRYFPLFLASITTLCIGCSSSSGTSGGGDSAVDSFVPTDASTDTSTTDSTTDSTTTDTATDTVTDTPSDGSDPCTAAGGTTGTATCCTSAGDYPDNCTTGACGCSPTNSHEVKTCTCSSGKCWNGSACVVAG